MRSPWWVSALVAAGIVALAHLVLSDTFAPLGKYAALPFIVIACVTGWRQLRTPRAERIAATLETLRSMSWEEFSPALEAAFRREGYDVALLKGAGADFVLTRDGGTSLVGCKRWKAALSGVEPLRELDAAKQAREARECIFVAAGEITENARAFATEKNIRLLHGAELAKIFAAGLPQR